MKLLLTFSLLLIGFVGAAQNPADKPMQRIPAPSGYGTCEDGLKRASTDFDSRKYNSYSYGFVVSTDFEFAEFYKNYMKKKYNVDMGNKGCVVSKEITCYSRKMKELILEKFGADFFDRTKKEARELFDKTD